MPVADYFFMLHTYYPSSVFFDCGLIQIRWYGLLITLSVLISFLIAKKLFKQYKLSSNILYDLGFYLVIFGLVGARMWHVFSEFRYYLKNPIDIIEIWNGGLAIHGAILSGILVTYFYFKKQKNKQNILLALDIFAPLVILGQAIGRWGNYFNQELYGRPLNAWWSIPIDFSHRLSGYAQYDFFHPIFLYESLWCLIIFCLLLHWHYLRIVPDSSLPIARKPSSITYCSHFVIKTQGFIFFSYIILYSIGRFAIGFLRIDPQISFFCLRFDQWISLVLICICAVVVFLFEKKSNFSHFA